MSGPKVATESRERTGTRSPVLMLLMATLGFAVNFWAWALISPLGPMFRESGSLGTLTESDVALLVAVPVLVGSLGRIVVGGLTDRYGGRVMFPLISAVTIVPILFLAFVALDSYVLLLVGGFVLGIAGTAFAVGVPFVNAWFPPEAPRSGGGRVRRRHGRHRHQRPDHGQALHRRGPDRAVPDHRSGAGGVRRGVVAGAPGRARPGGADHLDGQPVGGECPASDHVWQACLLYAVAFGGYVAFSVYLPAYLKTAHGLTPADAANRMAGFVVVAVLMRPIGGWASDRFGSIPVLTGVFGVVAVCAAISAGTPPSTAPAPSPSW